MLIGYVRVSKSDGSQTLAPQRDALLAAGVAPERIYEDLASGRSDARLGLAACLKALQPGNTLVIWKLDQLGRDLRHLVNTVEDLRVRHRVEGARRRRCPDRHDLGQRAARLYAVLRHAQPRERRPLRGEVLLAGGAAGVADADVRYEPKCTLRGRSSKRSSYQLSETLSGLISPARSR